MIHSSGAPAEGTLVDANEDLRRAAHPHELDQDGRPTRVVFSYPDVSVDVASFTPLEDSQRRFPTSHIAIYPCRFFCDCGHNPEHRPKPDNRAHAIIPGRLPKADQRAAILQLKEIHPPLSSGA